MADILILFIMDLIQGVDFTSYCINSYSCTRYYYKFTDASWFAAIIHFLFFLQIFNLQNVTFTIISCTIVNLSAIQCYKGMDLHAVTIATIVVIIMDLLAVMMNPIFDLVVYLLVAAYPVFHS